ncbi:MAG TPA: MFS transporter [Capillimicrobium sp.]|nr:MFS transporter [Capillimicrobium sp.]
MEGSDRHPSRSIAAITAIAAVGGFLFGYDTGVISGALLFIRQDFDLTAFEEGAIVGSLLLGAMIGALAGGSWADRFGRKRTIVAAAALFVAGIVLAILAESEYVLILARFVIGLGVGVASDTVPLYIGEMAPPETRGRLVSMNQLMITVGIVAAYLVDYAFSGDEDWRAMFAVGLIPAAILGLGMLTLPESPRWARSQAESRVRRDWRALAARNLRLVLAIGIGLAVLQQITGINTVIYYAPTILQEVGLASDNAILSAVPIGIVNIAMTVVSILVIDRVGRRPLLIVSLTGMVISIAGLGVVFEAGAGGALAVVCLVAYVAAFAVGMGPIFWLLIAEIYPQRVRGEAMSVATASNWLANFAVAQTFPLLLSAIGSAATFWIYAGLGVLAIWFALALVPETKDRTLEELEAELVGPEPARASA